MISELRRFILGLLSRRPTPAQRRQLADELAALADEQRQLADAEQRQLDRPAQARVGRQPQSGPGRVPGLFIRIERRDKVRLFMGRGLWYEIESPARVDVQRLGSALYISPAEWDAGYAVMRSGMPRITCSRLDTLLPPDGTYPAVVVGGRIKMNLGRQHG